ncbi:MAG: hypothetical protein EU530_01545 [Promethearchaeota archaeon]|nr:MAG: hypothetical protein EU530_01545 [Candidatus Lokiarchaeota archaeon]
MNMQKELCLITGESPETRSLVILMPLVGYIILGSIPLFFFVDKFTKKGKRKKKSYKSFTSPELIDKIENANES